MMDLGEAEAAQPFGEEEMLGAHVTVDRELARQVSRMRALDLGVLGRVCEEIAAANIPWTQEYSEYQSDGWLTCSLLNHSGDARDNRIRLSEPIGTEVLAQLPQTASLIASLGVDVFWARLARLEPDSYLWEHVDYEEFPDAAAMRLHIPLDTHPGARLVFAAHSVWLPRGHVWRLNPRDTHGAANIGALPRDHLIIDCRISPGLSELASHEDLPPDVIEALPPAPEGLVADAVARARSLAKAGDLEQAERELLTLFHRHTLPPGRPYDLLIRLYEELDLTEQRDVWRDRRMLFLGGAEGCVPAPSAALPGGADTCLCPPR